VSASDATVKIVGNSQISGNTSASHGGGMYVRSYGAIFEIENSTISGNAGHGGGIVVMADEGRINIKNSTISDNDALSNQPFAAGLHIVAENIPEVELINVRVTQNEAVDGIGGVYIKNSNSQVTIADCNISENTGRSIASYEVGGGLYTATGAGGQVTIEESIITNNKAGFDVTGTTGYLPNSGGGVLSFTDRFEGGATPGLLQTVTIANTEISGNHAIGGASVALAA